MMYSYKKYAYAHQWDGDIVQLRAFLMLHIRESLVKITIDPNAKGRWKSDITVDIKYRKNKAGIYMVCAGLFMHKYEWVVIKYGNFYRAEDAEVEVYTERGFKELFKQEN